MTLEEWLDKVEKDKVRWTGECLNKKPVGPAFTESGMPVEVLYTPADLKTSNYFKDIGNPGEYPFTRGVYPSMYRGNIWSIRQYAGYSTAEESNRRYKFLLENGQTGLSVAFDLPTQLGLDSDDPSIIEEEVGRVGVALDSLQDMEMLFEDIPLDRITTSFTINAPTVVILAMYIAAGEKQGVPMQKLKGTLQNDILKEYLARGTYIFPPRPSLKLTTDVIEFCSRNVPKFNPISISGYHVREAGANAYQEVAYALSEAKTYVDEVLKRGLHVDEFAPRLSFIFSSGMDLFEEVAKHRACRRLWARIMRDEYNSRDPQSQRMRFFAGCNGTTLTAKEPLNNIIRTTIECLATILGGAQSCHVMSFDEAYAIPTEESARVALRTQQIIAFESGVTNSVDPLGGSYYVEFLTNKVEEKAREEMGWVEENGGMVACVEKGLIHNKIARQAYEKEKKIRSGEKVVVGLNKFVADDCCDTKGAGKGPEMNLHKADPEVYSRQVKRLKSIKRNRDNSLVKETLGNLEKAARKDIENLMPYVIDAVKAYATIGEITGVLREVYGTFKCPTGI
ncbi:methylmalonyl-CoA mutase [Desulfallas sp. Bu1-1]|uniref:acyl-CoA mutase large subunit family protein n=1 Tax=Desulfallas sp. Bu1-1 TaxID=2787620 RepID=UPI00189DDB91|nr:methylmalonyl-CoA mutase family protein [Desulfallas sp. Bu1-1]MBF7084511.1 methylmalonyl-CoA mutase [Desulfallas sp. Bu1-1]